MLKLAGEASVGFEEIETITYSPVVEDTGDLEAGTNNITATSEASGVGNADYSKALTIDTPNDTRLVIERIATRLAATIDSMTAGHLYCRVYVDAQDADHRLFDEDWTGAGDKLDTVAKTSGAIFDLLKDGSAHTFYFFFWVDADNAVISVVQLWEAVGAAGTEYQKVLSLNHTGFISLETRASKTGTGSASVGLNHKDYVASYPWTLGTRSSEHLMVDSALIKDAYFEMHSTVATDLTYFKYPIVIILRSER